MSSHGAENADSDGSMTIHEPKGDSFYLLGRVSSPFLPGLNRVLVRDRIWVTKTAQGNVCINEWIIQRTIGRGAYASVRLCHNPLTEEKAAMRMINRPSLRRKLLTQESADHFLWNCSRIMDFLSASHPSILSLIEVMYQPMYIEACDMQNPMETIIPGSSFVGQYSLTLGNLPQCVQTMFSLASDINIIWSISTKYKSIISNTMCMGDLLPPDGASASTLPTYNPMAINGNVKSFEQGSDFVHRRVPSAGNKLKQYSSQLDSNLTPRYPQTTGRCSMNYDDNFVYIIEHCDGGTLQEMVRTAELSKIMITFYHVVDGLCYMHFCNIVHQDLKLENIMLSTDLKKTFKTMVPPASKLLPRRVPQSTDLFFTSRQGTIYDLAKKNIPSQSNTPLTGAIKGSDLSHASCLDNIIPRSGFQFGKAETSGGMAQKSCLNSSMGCDNNNMDPCVLQSEPKFGLRTLRDSSDITYYLLGDSDTVSYRAKINDFDTSVILEEEGIRLPTIECVLHRLKQLCDDYVTNLQARFTSFTSAFDQPQYLDGAKQSEIDESLPHQSIETVLKQSVPVIVLDSLATKDDLSYCSDGAEMLTSTEFYKHNTNSLEASLSIYKMSGIYTNKSLEISKKVVDKPQTAPTNALANEHEEPLDTSLSTGSLVVWDIQPDNEIIPIGTLRSSRCQIILSANGTSNDAAEDLTPKGTIAANKLIKEHVSLEAATPDDCSLIVATNDFPTNMPNDLSIGMSAARLTMMSKIENFIQDEIQENNLNTSLLAYIHSVKHINFAPTMPKSTYFIGSSLGTPNILSPESRVTTQTRLDDKDSRTLFSAVHADSWQVGVMLFHGLTGIVRRVPLYRYSQEALALCGSFGMLIADLLCGLLDVEPSHRYTLFECMYHPAVNPRELRLPMNIPAKGTMDVTPETAQSIISNVRSAAASKLSNIRSLWKETTADYLLLRRFHMFIVLRRRQYAIYNTRSCLVPSTIDNAFIYTSSDVLFLKNALVLFYSRVCRSTVHAFTAKNKSVIPRKTNTYARITTCERRRYKQVMHIKMHINDAALTPPSTSDISGNKHTPAFKLDLETNKEADMETYHSDSDVRASLHTKHLAHTKDSKRRLMSQQLCTFRFVRPKHPSREKAADPDLTLLLEDVRYIELLLERTCSVTIFDDQYEFTPYHLPSFNVQRRVRKKELLSVIKSSSFFKEPCSSSILTSRRRRIFKYIKRLLITYQQRLSDQPPSVDSVPRLRTSLSSPDLRRSSLINQRSDPFEHPLLDVYDSIKKNYMKYSEETNLSSDGMYLLDSVFSESFANQLQALVNDKNALHTHNFETFTRLSPLDIYIGIATTAIHYSLNILQEDVSGKKPPNYLTTLESLSSLVHRSTLSKLISRLRRMQMEKLLDELAVLSVGTSFYEIGTNMWRMALVRSFWKVSQQEEGLERLTKGILSPYHFSMDDTSLHSTHEDLDCIIPEETSSNSVSDDNLFKSPFNRTELDTSKAGQPSLAPVTAPSIDDNIITGSHVPESAQCTAISPRLVYDTHEISEIEHISMAAAASASLSADHTTKKLKIPPLKLNQQSSVPGSPCNIPSMPPLNPLCSNIASPSRHQETRLNQVANPTTSSLIKKYYLRNQLLNKAALTKFLTGLDAQKKKSQTFSDDRESFLGNTTDSVQEVGTEEHFLLKNNILGRAIEEYVVAAPARKNLKEVAGFTSLFDDSVCTTVDDNDNDDGDDDVCLQGEIGGNRRIGSLVYDRGQENVPISTQKWGNNKQMGSLSRLRNTSTVNNEEIGRGEPCVKEKISAQAPSLIQHASKHNEHSGDPLNKLKDLTYKDECFVCCYRNYMKPKTSTDPHIHRLIEILVDNYKFRYKYGCRMPWDPGVLVHNDDVLARGAFLQKAIEFLASYPGLTVEWLNLFVQQEISRWNDYFMQTESDVKAKAPTSTEEENKSMIQTTNQQNLLKIPMLDLHNSSKEHITAHTSMCNFSTYEDQPEDSLELSPPQVKEGQSVAKTAMQPSYPHNQDTKQANIQYNPSDACSENVSISLPPLSQSVEGCSQHTSLAGVFAIQTAIPSTMHVSKASKSTSSTSIGQCSTDSSEV